jgi:hypothetical protein
VANEASIIVSDELAVPKAAKPAAPEPMTALEAEPVELPTSNNAKLLVIGTVAAIGLLAVVGGVIAFGGSDEPITDDRATAAAPEATPEPTAETTPETAGAATDPGEEPAAAPSEPAPAEEAGSEVATAAPEAAEAEGAEAAEAEPEAEEEAAEEPAATTAVLSVQTEPEDATLTLDGREVENPYRGELEIGSRHRLRAEAAGHRPRTQTVRVSEDQSVVLRLPARPARLSSSIRRGGRGSSARGRSGRGRSSRGRSGRGRSGRGGASSSSGGSRGAAFSTDNPY